MGRVISGCQRGKNENNITFSVYADDDILEEADVRERKGPEKGGLKKGVI